jgi:hypothetical protein
MSDPRIPLKQPVLAAILALLIPGAGHLYQGRFFKAAIYAACILGTFTYGMYMAEWKAVYRSADPTKRNLGYYAQAATGLPALYAIPQLQRYKKEKGGYPMLEAPLSEPFSGTFTPEAAGKEPVPVSGHIQLEPALGQQGSAVQGTLDLDNGDKLSLGGGEFFLGRKVGGHPGRALKCSVMGQDANGNELTIGHIDGEIPRPFFDWFEAPLEDEEIQDVNRRLGKRYELALVYTWIAGLLNILAVWDALEGPAYGYGDEEDDDEDEEKKKKQPEKQPGEKTLAAAKS